MSAGRSYPFFETLIVVTLVIIFTGASILIRGLKDKKDFPNVSGKITYLDKLFEDLPKNTTNQYRYLIIDNYPKVYEIFIGKNWGGFMPVVQKIDSLNVGDEISIFFEADAREDDRLNKSAYFIDKGTQPYFVRHRLKVYIGYFLIGVGSVFSMLLFYLKSRGTIR